ncbi:phage tail protein [Photorhabdus luminescens]|uniref:phage tail protein n=1 Tax=Photorhabdus akhurstii TaxID=171438 RepID=UPI00052D75FB|nr:hypothetical protein KS18_13460 [Photorhabdus luminescens]
MKKPELLRQALIKEVPYLHIHPEVLSISTEKGVVIATAAESFSFEYNYILNLVISHYADDLNLLVVPMLQWIKKNQPDLMNNPELRKTGFTFAVDTPNQSATNIKISLKLTERVLVSEDHEKNITIKNLSEPELPF